VRRAEKPSTGGGGGNSGEYDSELNDSARVKSFIDTWHIISHKISVGSRKKKKDFAWEISGSTITLVSNNKSPRWKFLKTLNNNKLSNNLYINI